MKTSVGSFRKTMTWVLLAAVMETLSACSLAPEYVRPEMDIPQEWTRQEEQGRKEDLAIQWWKRFNDPVLNRLVREGLLYNRDLLIAQANVDYARSQLVSARSSLFPQITAQADALPVYIDGVKAGSSAPYSASFAAAWELDLWGKYRNASEAARARFLASSAAQSAARLSLAGQIASAYFQLRSLDLQLLTAQRTLGSRLAGLTINEVRFKQGLISELDLTQAQTVVESARTSIHQTRVAIEAAEGALAVLLGRSPREVLLEKAPRGLPLEALPAPPVIPAGIPSDLLQRRPDLIDAEQSLLAANADVGVARAEYLPNISLTGALGVVSSQLGDLFRSPLKSRSYGGSASVPILNFGRVHAGVQGAEARLRAEYAAYEKAVLVAFSDIRSALAAQRESERIVAVLERQVRQFRLALKLARIRYDNGYSAFLDVLDAERSLFQSEMELAAARSDRLTAIVRVCMALGGGWK